MVIFPRVSIQYYADYGGAYVDLGVKDYVFRVKESDGTISFFLIWSWPWHWFDRNMTYLDQTLLKHDLNLPWPWPALTLISLTLPSSELTWNWLGDLTWPATIVLSLHYHCTVTISASIMAITVLFYNNNKICLLNIHLSPILDETLAYVVKARRPWNNICNNECGAYVVKGYP